MIAELTHRCPLRCAYCSNPTELTPAHAELGEQTWARVLSEASELGVRMVHFTGGEPLLRSDLEALVQVASRQGLYATLVTSGIAARGLEPTEGRVAGLARAGLRSAQVSFQGTRLGAGADVAGRDFFAQKLAFCDRVKQAGLSLTVNFVLHRDNVDAVDAAVQLALALGADRAELAHVQFHGWAEQNRARLLPSPEQIERCRESVARLKLEHSARIDIVHVMPDYFSGKVKACMGGWGRTALVVAPDGTALPCHGASSLPLVHDRVDRRSVAEIWEHGRAFHAFRGTFWMQEPCASCSERHHDFGGCRCQAFALTGEVEATDPACPLSPQHARIVELRSSASTAGNYTLRKHLNKTSRLQDQR